MMFKFATNEQCGPKCHSSNNMLDSCLARQICDAIFTLIPEEDRLKELFLGWTILDAEEKEMIDNLIFQTEKLYLYKPLRDAMQQWELVQDTQGAPGCKPGLVSFPCDPQIEKDLKHVIYTLEKILGKFHKENKNCLSSENMCSSSVANNLDELTPERTQSDSVITEEIHNQLVNDHNKTIVRSFSLDGLYTYKY